MPKRGNYQNLNTLRKTVDCSIQIVEFWGAIQLIGWHNQMLVGVSIEDSHSDKLLGCLILI